MPAQADAVCPWTSPNTPALCSQGELEPGAIPEFQAGMAQSQQDAKPWTAGASSSSGNCLDAHANGTAWRVSILSFMKEL